MEKHMRFPALLKAGTLALALGALLVGCATYVVRERPYGNK